MGDSLRALIVEKSERDALRLVNELKRAGAQLAYERADSVEALARALSGGEWDVVIVGFSALGSGAGDAVTPVQQNGADAPMILVVDAGQGNLPRPVVGGKQGQGQDHQDPYEGTSLPHSLSLGSGGLPGWSRQILYQFPLFHRQK